MLNVSDLISLTMGPELWAVDDLVTFQAGPDKGVYYNYVFQVVAVLSQDRLSLLPVGAPDSRPEPHPTTNLLRYTDTLTEAKRRNVTVTETCQRALKVQRP